MRKGWRCGVRHRFPADGLKPTVTAEGVHTEGQRERLRHLGCDQIQGYVFSPPAPRDRVIELLTGGQAQA
jgi:EAL domain-containing protein (putative c-di-GMP-specific phosphodiesterase class I)